MQKWGAPHFCNAHIKRELERIGQKGQKWAIRLKEFLLKLNEMVEAYGGVLPLKIQRAMRRKYRKLLKEGRKETNFPKDKGPPGKEKKRGRPKKKKEHNLIERLEDNEDAVLRFMEDKDVPFSNNDAERPVRSVKIHQKISGTFRSEEYMGNWCLLQSYIMSCNKNGVNPCEALRMLEQDIVPEFIQKVLDRPSKKRKKKKAA